MKIQLKCLKFYFDNENQNNVIEFNKNWFMEIISSLFTTIGQL